MSETTNSMGNWS